MNHGLLSHYVEKCGCRWVSLEKPIINYNDNDNDNDNEEVFIAK